MLVAKEEDQCKLTIGENTKLLILGGQPFDEERFIDWNFVSTDKQKLEEAKGLWLNMKFEMVPKESGYVPIPG